jgi:hypothetical protein
VANHTKDKRASSLVALSGWAAPIGKKLAFQMPP